MALVSIFLVVSFGIMHFDVRNESVGGAKKWALEQLIIQHYSNYDARSDIICNGELCSIV